MSPDDLARLWRERANEGDIDGILALYEPGAVTTFLTGASQLGHEEIRAALEKVLANRKPGASTSGEMRPTLIASDLALTSARIGDTRVTAEVARRQPDGSWLWVLDKPDFLADHE
jgi:ketosteroid isomerase-like protein